MCIFIVLTTANVVVDDIVGPTVKHRGIDNDL